MRTASGESAIIEGGRDAIQVHTTNYQNTVSVTAQYLSLTVLLMIFVVVALQFYRSSEMIENLTMQNRSLKNLYEIKISQQQWMKKLIEED